MKKDSLEGSPPSERPHLCRHSSSARMLLCIHFWQRGACVERRRNWRRRYTLRWRERACRRHDSTPGSRTRDHQVAFWHFGAVYSARIPDSRLVGPSWGPNPDQLGIGDSVSRGRGLCLGRELPKQKRRGNRVPRNLAQRDSPNKLNMRRVMRLSCTRTQPLPKGAVQARLPAGAIEFEGLHDVRIQPDIHVLFGVLKGWPPSLRFEQFCGVVLANQPRQNLAGRLGLCEPLFRQFR